MKNRVIYVLFALPLLSNTHLQYIDLEEKENPFIEMLNKPVSYTWNNRYLVDHSRNLIKPYKLLR